MKQPASEKTLAEEYESGMTTRRIEALTDGVYAIAMTILVLNFKVPVVPAVPHLLFRALTKLTPKFIDYGISFMILASFWTGHHRQFHHTKKANNQLLWLNILSLLFIILIPFSTSLYSEYGTVQIAALFFEINILIVSLIYLWQWLYITDGHRLVDPELSAHLIDSGTRVNLVVPTVSLIAIGVSFFSPDNSTLPFILIPVVMVRLRKS